MRHSPFTKVMIIILALLFALAVPAFGQVRNVRAKTLQQPGDIMTTRKANFQAGDILGSSLISVTINNGADADAFLLIKMKIQFGGDWSSEFVEASFVKKMLKSTGFTFTNKDLISYLGGIRTSDLKYSETLITKTGISDVSQIANIGSLRLPEGTYSISISVSEITLSDPADINSTYDVKKEWIKENDSGAKVEFNVVTIGNLEVVKLPTYNDLNLAFKVPEIPVYDDAKGVSVSSTRVRITGSDNYSYTAVKQHQKSTAGSLSFKGYPSDLKADEGRVTYALGGAKFRAGETYSIEMSYIDWNGDTIISLTKSVTFPTPKVDESYTIDPEDPFKPSFAWNFRSEDYSSWVLEYRVFVNNAYMGKTTDTSYALTEALVPGSSNTWYVMPYNKDGTPFFASSSGLVQSLPIKAHTELTVATREPASRSILIKGETYDFAGRAEFSDGAVEKTSVWKIGNDTRNGREVRYAPGARYSANSLTATLTVTDSLNLQKSAPALQLTVIDPAIALAGATALTIDKGVTRTFSLDGGKTQDIAAYEWFLGGSSAGTGSGPKSLRFDEKGTFELYVQGTSAVDVLGNAKTVQSGKVTVTVSGAAPAVSISRPAAGSGLILNNTVRVVAAVENENALRSTVWTVQGPDTSQNGAAGQELSFRPTKVGEYTLTCVVTDEFQKKGQASIRILVSNPAIAISAPTRGQVFPLTGALTPTISAPNASRIAWFIDDAQVSGSSYVLAKGGTGEFTLKATGYWATVDMNGNPTEYNESVEVSFTVKDLTPPQVALSFPESRMVLKAGESYTLQASAESDSRVDETWWTVDGTRLNSASYTIPENTTKKSMTFAYWAKNVDGVVGSKSVSVQIINPSVYFAQPAANQYPMGSPVPVSATAIDASLFWLVDGTEVADWNKIFTTHGLHSVQAGWKASAVDGSGGQREYTGLSRLLRLTIYSTAAPSISGFAPSAVALRETKGTAISFSLDALSDNTLQPTLWSVLQDGSFKADGAGRTFSYTFADPGQYTVRGIVLDAYGYRTTKEWTVKVIDPAIAISAPTAGTAYGLGAVPAPTVTSQDIASFVIVLDGQTIGQGFNWARLAAGEHRLRAVGSYTVTSQSSPREITSQEIAFSVVDMRPPEVTLEGIADGDRIVAGREYTFRARGNVNVRVEWFKNGTKVDADGASPDAIRFTPQANEGEIRLTARLTSVPGGVAAEKTVEVKVISPSVRIVLPTTMARNGFYPPQTPLPLQAESLDVNRIVWTVDNQDYSGQTVSFAPGNHTVAVKGIATGVRLPSLAYGDFEVSPSGAPNFATLAVAEALSLATMTATPAVLYTGQPVNVSVTTAGNGTILDYFTYSINGSVYFQGKSATLAIPTLAAGTHVISVKSVDLFGGTSANEATVTVYPPLSLVINQPANEARLSPDANLMVSVSPSSSQYTNLIWSLDGAPVANASFTAGSLGKLRPGTHVIGVSALDALRNTLSASVTIEVQSDFQLNLLSPSTNIETILGSSVSCIVGIDKVAGSDISLSDAAGFITWYLNGTSKGKGLTYTFTADAAGAQVIQARYEKDGMVHSTLERTIQVRDIADPTIQKPANGTSIIYAQGDTVALVAEGEPGATFAWSIEGMTIAYGNQASFDPKGISGQKQLKLTTTAFGRTKETLVTVTLAVDSPPILTLSAPSPQFTGQALSWSATAFDTEDQESPQIEIFFDGVPVAVGNPRVLESGDIGQHSLLARAKDKHGVASTLQVSLMVEPSQVPIEIQSPLSAKPYYLGYDIALIASLGAGSGISGGPGSFVWTVTYLDDTAAQAESASGQNATFSPKALGDATVTARYFDGTGKERGSKSVGILIEREPLELSIDWPHGAMVNAGDSLKPRLLGLPQGSAPESVAWTLNGAPVANIAAFTAPAEAGQYLLAATYGANGASQTAQAAFSVNAAPRLTIESPAAGRQFAFGSPIVLAAKVEDDQPFDGTIAWKSGTAALGAGNPLVYTGAPVGFYQVSAEAQDRYGASGTASVGFTVYAPVSNIAATVNGGHSVYLLVSTSPAFGAKVAFLGGINPVATWTFRQGDKEQAKDGAEVGFSFGELAQFEEGPAVLTLNIADPGLADEAAREIFRKDFPVALVKDAVATLASPVQGDLFRVGEAVPLRVGVAGFNAPTFALTLNGAAVPVQWAKQEGEAFYSSEIPSSALPSEGVYELAIVASENGASSSIAYTLNVYKPRVGIFVDDAPTQYDLLGGPRTVNANVAGLVGVTEIQWKNDLSSSVIGSGTSLDLSAAGLKPGNRAITVEAKTGTQTLASATFLLKVLGAMEIAILPADEPLIVQRGGALTLEARVVDRDGSAITGDAITWTSHLDGLLGKGTSLDLAPLALLSGGDHIITVEGTGAGGNKISALKRIQVRVHQAGDPGGRSPGGEDDSEDGDSDDQDDLDEGEEMHRGPRQPRQMSNGILAMAAAAETAFLERRYKTEYRAKAEYLIYKTLLYYNKDVDRRISSKYLNLYRSKESRYHLYLREYSAKMTIYTRDSEKAASRAMAAEVTGNTAQAEASRKLTEEIKEAAELQLERAEELLGDIMDFVAEVNELIERELRRVR
ncbi:MAG: hypothetical protein FD137_190 [Spirochaetes bacterium]|nr:MAG: hypothetical protein FD137_190 [Spirochaetota bacterium]